MPDFVCPFEATLQRRIFRRQLLGAGILTCAFINSYASAANNALANLGSALFEDNALSGDGETSCRSCHDPAHAYASPERTSIGAGHLLGTRNAPSLVGIANYQQFFWDGRRTRLDQVVLDPFTNPVELGLASTDQLIELVRADSALIGEFHRAFPSEAVPTPQQISDALGAFILSLRTGTSDFDDSHNKGKVLEPRARHGEELFNGTAGCSVCHLIRDNLATFEDGQFHHSGVSPVLNGIEVAAVAKVVVAAATVADEIGPKVLSDSAWSEMGRFVVTRRPQDIGLFRTPSLRNAAVTAPYMHDGSISTLAGAVDHEIYYRGQSAGQPHNLSSFDRDDLVAFLETLTDAQYQPRHLRK